MKLNMQLKNGKNIIVIISEKQIMHLLQIASQASCALCTQSDNWRRWSESVARFLDEIHNQQSSELKAIE